MEVVRMVRRCNTPKWQGNKGWNVWLIRVATVVVDILMGFGGFDMDRDAELTVVNADIDIQRGAVGGGSVRSKVNGIATVEPFKKSREGVKSMGPE